uniref:Pentatricopeptide repeat-containing protein n=1 Tax=Kalanchoe fedtschenkoi TaxID=63787 RepID=A0A7N0TE75_KALFE
MANRIFRRISSPAPAPAPALSHRFSTVNSLSSLPPSPVVNSVVSILKHHRSKSRWSELQSLFPNGFSPSEASDIIIDIKNNAHLALRFFDWTRSKSLCRHDLLSYSTIIHVLARSRQKARAEALIRSAFRVSESGVDLFESLARTYRKCDSAPFVFDLLINACLECKKIDSAVQIVRLLQSRGISPNSRVCSSLISAVCRHQGADAGYAIYKLVFGVGDVEIFNSLMLGYYQAGELERVREIWDEMAEFDHISANESSYGVLLAACCDKETMEEAEEIWNEMGGKGLKRDVAAYNSMIGGFCRIGEMGKAGDCWREMVLNGVEGTCVTHESFVKGYCRVGDVDAALVASKVMSGGGFVAQGSTIDGLVEELCGKGRALDGFEVLKNAMENVEFIPSGMSFRLLLKGLCSQGMMGEALMLQAEMASKGFEPDAEVYSAFLDGYEELGNSEKVESLRKEMLELRVSN